MRSLEWQVRDVEIADQVSAVARRKRRRLDSSRSPKIVGQRESPPHNNATTVSDYVTADRDRPSCTPAATARYSTGRGGQNRRPVVQAHVRSTSPCCRLRARGSNRRCQTGIPLPRAPRLQQGRRHRRTITSTGEMTVNGCPVQAPLGRGITWAEINGPPHALHALTTHMSVILSGVRRQPNVVERPRCCLDLTRQIYISTVDRRGASYSDSRQAVPGSPEATAAS